MRVNIENCNNTGDPSAKEWVLGELVRNLKELRDRTDAGDMKALDEFFGLFVFNDDQDRKKVGASETAHDWTCVSPGEYDTLYECAKCGARHMEQADRLGSERPKVGCTHNALGEGRERGILREASSGEAATSTDGLGVAVPPAPTFEQGDKA